MLLFLLSCMLFAGCTSTKATSSIKMKEAKAVQNAPENQKYQVPPPNKIETKNPNKLRHSTQGNFSGDKDVFDDF